MSVARARLLVAAVAVSACSIEFVAPEEPVPATSVSVRSVHADDLHAEVVVGHRGPVAPLVRVNGSARSPAPDPNGLYEVALELTVDTALPVLAIEVGQPGQEPLRIEVPLLIRTGEAECTAEGGLRLPYALPATGLPTGSEQWTVSVLDGEGAPLTWLESTVRPANPLIAPPFLAPAEAARVELRASIDGPLPGAPHEAYFGMRSTAVWVLSGACTP